MHIFSISLRSGRRLPSSFYTWHNIRSTSSFCCNLTRGRGKKLECFFFLQKKCSLCVCFSFYCVSVAFVTKASPPYTRTKKSTQFIPFGFMPINSHRSPANSTGSNFPNSIENFPANQIIAALT